MNSLIGPNLNADVYRNITKENRTRIHDKHLQFVLIHNEKSALLGASYLTGCYWTGDIWYYTDISDFDQEKASANTKTISGVCDAVFIDNDKFVIGQDNGALQVFDIATSSPDDAISLPCAGYACSHDSSLLTLSAFADKKHVASGGMDCCIKIWDIPELFATLSFNGAHTDTVTCIDVKPESNTEFVSTSIDGEALLWDLRLMKPARKILKIDAGLTAVSWNPSSKDILAIGTDHGEVMIIDVKEPGSRILRDSNAVSKPVHKLLFNPHSDRSRELAVCWDDISVEVLDTDVRLSPIYIDNRHTDFARGLTWFDKCLYSCSWDNTVLKHTIAS